MTHINDLTDRSNPTRRIRTRNEGDVDALVLHQMSFNRGDSPLSYLNTNAHFIILRGGQVAQLHHVTDYLYASSALNARSMAVEFAGNMPSARDWYYKPDKYGRHRVTMEQVTAGRWLLQYVRRKYGITHVFAHRQGTNGHTNCCGPDVWFNVGEWGIANGFSDGGIGYKVGPGLPIPNSWRNHGYMVFTEAEAGAL